MQFLSIFMFSGFIIRSVRYSVNEFLLTHSDDFLSFS